MTSVVVIGYKNKFCKNDHIKGNFFHLDKTYGLVEHRNITDI